MPMLLPPGEQFWNWISLSFHGEMAYIDSPISVHLLSDSYCSLFRVGKQHPIKGPFRKASGQDNRIFGLAGDLAFHMGTPITQRRNADLKTRERERWHNHFFGKTPVHFLFRIPTPASTVPESHHEVLQSFLFLFSVSFHFVLAVVV